MSVFRIGSAPGKSFLQPLADSQSREQEAAEVTVSERVRETERGVQTIVSIQLFIPAVSSFSILCAAVKYVRLML